MNLLSMLIAATATLFLPVAALLVLGLISRAVRAFREGDSAAEKEHVRDLLGLFGLALASTFSGYSAITHPGIFDLSRWQELPGHSQKEAVGAMLATVACLFALALTAWRYRQERQARRSEEAVSKVIAARKVERSDR